ncbi:MAG: glycoside hydrolase family 88 protein [Clostridia bacterium]|nr:glycoside hydrolase family 88 protein [Clostridia bacterium]
MPLKIPEIQSPERFSELTLTREMLEDALRGALMKIDLAIETMDGAFPSAASKNNVYQPTENTGSWIAGFWTGILWHAYELSGEEKYKSLALSQIPSYTKRINERLGVDHHDMGFLYTPSCVAAYKITGDEEARRTALLAAENLAARYQSRGGFIQAWGALDDPTKYRLIVDCLLNIPLLYWAAEETGNNTYDKIAFIHFNTTADVAWRADAGTYHTYYFDYESGKPDYGATKQGASDDSSWARGQSWGITGPILTYAYKKCERAMHYFKASTNYMLNRLPLDYIPYWDLIFGDGDGEPRDSSSAAITICGLLEGVKHMEESDPLRAIYYNAACHMMSSLILGYTSRTVREANGLLLHGTYTRPSGNGVDEMNIWGDYFYMEALHRMLDPEWKMYW